MDQLESGKNLAQVWFSMTPTLICEGQENFTALRQKNVMQDGSLDRLVVEYKQNSQRLVRLIEMIIARLIPSSITEQSLIVKKGSSEFKFHSFAQ